MFSKCHMGDLRYKFNSTQHTSVLLHACFFYFCLFRGQLLLWFMNDQREEKHGLVNVVISWNSFMKKSSC